jgi:DNA-binding NarL/FixJ family response regulator
MSFIKVLVVDDHPVIRAGIKNLLVDTPDIRVIGEAGSGREALEQIENLVPDVMLLDMELPDIDGTVVARQLQEKGSPVRILALSAHNEKQYIKNLLETGVSGYLTKDELPDSILEAVRGVYQGEKGWISRKVAAQLPSLLEGDLQEKSELSKRELEVIEGIVAGRTNREIGQRLGISNRTVEKYVESIFAKLCVTSRVEAAVTAVQKGLV